jgi:hypothetical protein
VHVLYRLEIHTTQSEMEEKVGRVILKVAVSSSGW